MREQCINYLLRIVSNAIESESSYYIYHGDPVHRDVKLILDALSGLLFDLIDGYWYALDIGNIDASNKYLGVILRNDILKLLVAYYMDIPAEKGISHD